MTVNGAEYTVRRLLGTLYYIDYECNAYMEQWDFEQGYPALDGAGTGKDGGNMKILWEDRLLYAIPALLVLAAYCDV